MGSLRVGIWLWDLGWTAGWDGGFGWGLGMGLGRVGVIRLDKGLGVDGFGACKK